MFVKSAGPQIRRPPVASDAEIRAYLLPRLKAGNRPTYAAMRADLGGGGFSRLVRIRNLVEAELSGDLPEPPSQGQVNGAELITTLAALFDRQWKALEEWEGRFLAHLDCAQPPPETPAARATGDSDAISTQLDRFEAVEGRLLAAINQLQSLTARPTEAPARAAAVTGELNDIPPSWARQAAAAASSALDGRLQSIEESVRDAAAGGQAAFKQAAEIAREVAADASLQMQMARSKLSKATKEELGNYDRTAALLEVQHAFQKLQGQVGAGFAAAASQSDRRAVAMRDVILAVIDIEMAQVEMIEVGIDALNTRVKRSRRRQ